MSLPKSAVLAEIDDGSSNNQTVMDNMINRVGIVRSIEGLEFPEITVFNDYVAILICKRKSSIALTGASTFSNVGVVVGVGKTCVNDFKLSQQVLLNNKGGAVINTLEELPAAYKIDGEKRMVVLVQERNIFYEAVGEEDAIVRSNCGVRYCKGVPIVECGSSCSCD